MIYKNVNSDQKPERVSLEELPEGQRVIRMADNIEEREPEEGGERKGYTYDEAVMRTDEGIDAEEISQNFAEWWEKAAIQEEEEKVEPEKKMTTDEMAAEIEKLKERNEFLENCLMEMSEVVYA